MTHPSQQPSAPGEKRVQLDLKQSSRHAVQTSTLSALELRRQIAAKVDVLGNIMKLARGEIPDEWIKNGRITDEEGNLSDGNRLTLGRIIEANYKLLDRILPSLKSIEITDNPDDKVADYELSRQRFLKLLESRLAAEDPGSKAIQ
jgi:hypothetical protein